MAYALREVLETARLDLPADVGGSPELVEAAGLTGEMKAVGGVRVKYVMYLSVLRGDDDLNVADLVLFPGEGGPRLCVSVRYYADRYIRGGAAGLPEGGAGGRSRAC